jgi:hypothetical protein
VQPALRHALDADSSLEARLTVVGFSRGAVGAAVLGAVFAAHAGSQATNAAGSGIDGALRSDIVVDVQAVFLVALVAVLAALKEVLLRGRGKELQGGGPEGIRAVPRRAPQAPGRVATGAAR